MITAVGIPHLVRGDWIKHGAFVIDVGVNYIHVNKGTLHIIYFCAIHFFENISLSTASMFVYRTHIPRKAIGWWEMFASKRSLI